MYYLLNYENNNFKTDYTKKVKQLNIFLSLK